jgi:hypothetical protein
MKHLVTALAFVLVAASAAHAIPELQLYIEGATYDNISESWVWDGILGTDPIRLWVIGNVRGPGGHGPISHVKLSAVYFNTGYVPTITLTPTTAGGTGSYGGFTDPSVPLAPVKTFPGHNIAGGTPTLSDGTHLASHGEYGDGRAWQEWELGNFTLRDSPVGDFIYDFPTTLYPGTAQINVYDVSISEYDFARAGEYIHFDAYNSVEAGNHARSIFAPFSHDATIPEPGTLALVGIGLAGLGARMRRKI